MDRKAIAELVRKISDSALSAAEYLRRHKIPFSLSQYYRYKRRLEAPRATGLEDLRGRGNRRTLTDEAKLFLRSAHKANPGQTLQKLSDALEEELKLRIHTTTIGRYLRSQGLKIRRPPRAVTVETIESACGGIEIIGAVAMHLGWASHTAKKIVQERERFRNSAAYRNERVRHDRSRRKNGRFTPAYNRWRKTRELRFASVEDKRKDKNYSRMKLFEVRQGIIGRKCLAILALPLITNNGATRSANNPLGNTLEHFCGFNYQHSTLEKFLRELKYLGISELLLRDQIPYWRQHWPELDANLPLVCYYVDGNTKALWSSKRVKQNKVTMLGRVMGCLEQVFVHDGFGHPVYMETYSGKAPVGEHVLEMFDTIGDSLEGPGPDLKVLRAIIMDSASNGVSTLRAFLDQDEYHYITALDDNQWKPRRIIKEGRKKRYRYGKANLRECLFEMVDSKEKGYLLEVRAILIEWDHGKVTVLVTSLPVEVVETSLVVKAYFDRWPCEELQFRGMKHFACLNKVAGYGKKELPDENMRAKQQKLRGYIVDLKRTVRVPLQRIADEQEIIAEAIEEERRIKAQGKVVGGARRLPAASSQRLKEINREIAASERRIDAIEAEAGNPLRRLRKHEKEWLRIEDKGTVYRVDVELDQLMGFFRIALVNMAAWFLRHCLKRNMSLARLFSEVLMLPARIELTDETRRVTLRRNEKNPQLMEQLEKALHHLTRLKIMDLQNRAIEFRLSEILS
jgi:transposase